MWKAIFASSGAILKAIGHALFVPSPEQERINEINGLMQLGEFWADHVKAAEITQELAQLTDVVTLFEKLLGTHP